MVLSKETEVSWSFQAQNHKATQHCNTQVAGSLAFKCLFPNCDIGSSKQNSKTKTL